MSHSRDRHSSDTSSHSRRRCDLSPLVTPWMTRIDYWVSMDGRKIRYFPFFFRADDGKVWCRIHGAKPKVCIRFTPPGRGHS